MDTLAVAWDGDWIWLFVYVLITFGAFLVASTLGIGGPLLLIPALMLHLPTAQAVAMVAPIMLVNSLVKLWVFREQLHLPAVGWTCASSLPIALMAATYTGSVDARLLRLGIAAIILAALVLRYGYHAQPVVGVRGLVGWGMLIGVIGGLLGTAGPILALSLGGHGLSRQRFVATAAAVQVLMQFVRVPTYLGTSTLPVDLLPLTLLLSVIAASSVWIARSLLARMPVLQFQRLLHGFLFIIAAWLIGQAMMG